MNANLLTLILFIVVVLVGFFKKMNVGILAIAVAVIAGRVFGVSDKEIISSFSVSLFVTLVGITLLFAVVNQTGALELCARKVVSLAGNRVWIIPIFIYVAGFAIAACGPGAIPSLAIIPPIAVSLALAVGYNPVMLALIGEAGLMAGRMTSITPEGVLITGLASEQGITNVMNSVLISNTITTVLFSLVLYFAYKGFKVKSAGVTLSIKDTDKFTSKQIISLLGMVAMLVLIIFFKVNVGLAAFFVGVTLIFFNVADETKCIKSVPWGTVLLVMGVGVLMNIVNKSGGIELLSNALANVMTPKTAAPIMGISAGLMSWVSSALGVVYPTLVPTVGAIANSVGGGVSPIALISAIGAGGSCAGISPISTGGALILTALASNKPNFSKEEQSKVFVELFLWAVGALALIAFLAFIGVFRVY
ncbi:MAG: SLC13 family permease [Lutisporaceae bacterium]